MAESTVAEICENRPDSTGAIVRTVYAKVDPIYAVYATDQRVMVQFADDHDRGSDQRLALAPLNAVRGEIDGVVDRWRDHRHSHLRASARRYERRLADALVVALQGQLEDAGAMLAAIKQELYDQRTSLGRMEYLATACFTVLFLIGICAVAASGWLARAADITHSSDSRALWFAAGVGTVGAFFSIAIAVRDRSVRPGFIPRDNVADAGLRILVGAISAVLLVSLMLSGLVTVRVGDQTLLQQAAGPLIILIVAFLAGFLERMVPDLLAKGSPTDAQQAAQPIESVRDAQRRMTANEMNPLGEERAEEAAESASTARIDPDPDDAEDACGLHGEEPATEDVELPEALGGVESPPSRS